MKTLREMIDLIEGRGTDVQGTFADLEAAGFILVKKQPKHRIYKADLENADTSPEYVTKLFQQRGWLQQTEATVAGFRGGPLPADRLIFHDNSNRGWQANGIVKDGIVDQIYFNAYY